MSETVPVYVSASSKTLIAEESTELGISMKEAMQRLVDRGVENGLHQESLEKSTETGTDPVYVDRQRKLRVKSEAALYDISMKEAVERIIERGVEQGLHQEPLTDDSNGSEQPKAA